MRANQNASIYVGDLDQEVTEANLYEIFNAVGPVSSVKICVNPQTQKSLGYAYVNFHKASDAERALDTMNFASIKGKPCRIMWSIRDKSVRDNGVGNIVIKNLDVSIDNKTLFDTFSMFGDILSCKVGTNAEGESLGYGFVHYVNPNSAKKAIEKINGMLIAEKKVTVEPFMKFDARIKQNDQNFTNVYIRSIPTDWTEAQIKEKINGFGETTSMLIPKDDSGTIKGFAFCNFKDHTKAKECCAVFNGEDGPVASRALSKAELKYKARKDAKAAKNKNLNLYVKNLSEDVSEIRLKALFEEYGKTSSVKLMLDSAGKSRGFGFVCFEEEGSASKAMAELNGKDVEGKEIYVGLAQTKAERQAYLSKKFAMSQKVGPAGFRPPFPGFPSAYAVPMRAGYPPYGGMPYPPPYPVPPMRTPTPLSTANLMGKSSSDMKQILGEKLYQQIQQVEPQKAGKITGMLLEMDHTEILHLLESRESLLSKVNDALLVLQHASSQ